MKWLGESEIYSLSLSLLVQFLIILFRDGNVVIVLVVIVVVVAVVGVVLQRIFFFTNENYFLQPTIPVSFANPLRTQGLFYAENVVWWELRLHASDSRREFLITNFPTHSARTTNAGVVHIYPSHRTLPRTHPPLSSFSS